MGYSADRAALPGGIYSSYGDSFNGGVVRTSREKGKDGERGADFS